MLWRPTRHTSTTTVANEPGTYWYHPHPHGLTGEQVYRGLAGLIIIHGDEPDLPGNDNDLSLVLQDRTIDTDGKLRYASTRHDTMAGFVGDTLVTNGVAGLTIDVRREAYRLRILNGANSRAQYLSWSTGDPCNVVATDGRLLPETISTPGVVITPAQRTDLWIDFSTYEPGQQIELLVADTFIEAAGTGGVDLASTTAATFRQPISDAHPMHLHGNAFRVVSRSWDNDSLADAWAALEHGVVETGLRDTVLVWPGQRVQIAVRFAEHQGYFLYHCHILEHEDGGMMRNFLVTQAVRIWARSITLGWTRPHRTPVVETPVELSSTLVI